MLAACGAQMTGTKQETSTSQMGSDTGPNGGNSSTTSTAASGAGGTCGNTNIVTGDGNRVTTNPNNGVASNPNNANPNASSYAFFEIGTEQYGGAEADGLFLVLTDNANFCVPTASAPGLTVAPVKQGSVTRSVLIAAPIRGYTVNTFLGAKDYPETQVSTDTHVPDPNYAPNTCTMFGGGPTTTADFNILSIDSNNTSMLFTLNGNSPVTNGAVRAKACNLLTADPYETLPYGAATWVEGNAVKCLP